MINDKFSKLLKYNKQKCKTKMPILQKIDRTYGGT